MSECTTTGIAGGTNRESDDSLRSRLLARVRETPHAGTAEDYKAWALEVAGVTRAWVYPLESGIGTVVIRFVCDDEDEIVPTEAMILKVQDYIDSVRPVTANVTVSAPTTEAVAFTIADLDPEDDSVKARIKESLVSLFQRESIPGGALLISHIRAAISAAAGEVDHVLVSPTENLTPAKGVLLTVGEITWQ